MKNKIINIFILIILVCSCYICNISYATETGTVYIQSDKEIIEKDDEIEISINLKDAKTAAFNFSLYFDDTKFECMSDFESMNIKENQILYVWYDENGGNLPKEGELAKFKFKAKEDGLATFVIQGEFYSETGQLIQIEFKEKQIQIGKEKSLLKQQAEEQGTNSQSKNAYLQVLRLDKEGISPSFDKDIYEYYLTIPNNIEEIEVLAISENPNATIEISGNTNLKNGLNKIEIIVTSPNQSQKKVYNIEVTKTDNLELSNANLEILAIENYLLNPAFDTNETNYNIEVSNTLEKINIFAVGENEEAKVEIIGTDNLKIGSNLVTVTVTAPNGFTKKKYLIEVYKRNAEEENTFLEEQKLQIEKAEEAYRLEETNANINKDNDKEEINNEKNNKYIIFGTSVIVFLIVIAAIFINYRKKYKK